MYRAFTLVVTVLLLATAANTATASDSTCIPPSRIGIYLNGGINFSSPEAQVWQLPIPSNPFLTRYANDSLEYSDASTTVTFLGGGMFGVPLSRMWHFTGRVGANWMTTSNTVDQQVSQDSSLTHMLSTSSVLLEIMPGVEVHGLFDAPIYLLGGIEFGIPLSTSREQTTDLYVNNEFRVKEVTTGPTEITDAEVRAALAIGAGYNVMLSESMWLQPEISYRLPLTQVTANEASSPWKIGQLRIGINLTFGIAPAPKEPEPETKKSSARFDPPTTYDKTGKEVTVNSLNVEDVAYTEMFPIVPYVFYPEHQAESGPEMQYMDQGEKGEFTPASLSLDAIEVNRNTLNIIGSRMKQHDNATLTITGTTDGKGEAKDKQLAEQRAQAAKNYLVKTFGIDSSRIAVRSTATPAKPSAGNDPEGVAENRRIEFASNVPDILTPLTITASNQRISTPDVVLFHPVVENADTVKDWTLTVMQAGRPIREMRGKGQPAKVTWPIKPNELSNAQVPVDYEFTAHTSGDQEVRATGSVPVDYMSSVRRKTEDLPDRSVDKYSLILFDFDKATLTDDNNRILEQTVLPSIKSNSIVTVVGYTDRIGSDDHNKQLSNDRATTVVKFLQGRAPDAKYSSSGVGESSEIFPNESPIGRQLSRTVQVIVETPRR